MSDKPEKSIHRYPENARLPGRHLSDGQLRSYIDRELHGEDALHLEGCSECQARLVSVRASAEHMHAHLFFLENETAGQEASNSARPALARFQSQLQQKEIPIMKKMFSNRIAWTAMVVVLVLALVLGVPDVRAWAGQFLNLFRVQQVTVLPVDLTGLNQLSSNQALGQQIGQILSNSVVMDRKGAAPQAVSSQAEASQAAGFNVRLPASATPSQLLVDQGFAFHFTVNRERAQAVLDEAGRKDLVLPKSIDGANIAVNVPASLTASFGVCPKPDKAAGDPDMAGSVGRNYPDCVMLMQIPSPTLSAPPDLDMKQLATMALEFTGMSAEAAQQFSDTVDWTTSLVIPIPKNAATYKQVQVDGVTGFLIQRPVDDAPQYALVWVKNGIIYVIGSLGNDTQAALDMANSLK